MEVKINKEIQSYSESMFFGLSMQQCGFSLAAVLVAVGLYFLLKPYVGTETEKRHHLAVMPFFWQRTLIMIPQVSVAPHFADGVHFRSVVFIFHK